MSKTLTVTKQAIDYIEGFRQIAERDMMVKGRYLSPTVVDEELRKLGTICGGHKACAVGSLWLAANQRPVKSADGWWLPSADESDRWAAMEDDPALTLAAAALNTAALEWGGGDRCGTVEANDVYVSVFASAYDWPLEALFEGGGTQLAEVRNLTLAQAMMHVGQLAIDKLRSGAELDLASLADEETKYATPMLLTDA